MIASGGDLKQGIIGAVFAGITYHIGHGSSAVARFASESVVNKTLMHGITQGVRSNTNY